MTIRAIPTVGQEIKTTDFQKYFYFLGSYILDGLDVSVVAGQLQCNVSTGVAKIGGIVVEITAVENVQGLTANIPNYVYVELTFDSHNEISGARVGANTDKAAGTNRLYIATVNVGGSQVIDSTKEPSVVHFTDFLNKMMIGFGLDPNAVNYVKLDNSARGNDVVITAEGADANINVELRPKGTGKSEIFSLDSIATNRLGFDVEVLASNEIDFANSQMQTRSIAANTTFTATNMSNGLMKTIRILNGANSATLTFPAAWKFVGTKPAEIAANKTAILTLVCFGNTEADVVAAYAVEP